MAFDYEQAKSQYGAGRAREMESEANKPQPSTPAAPTTADLTKTTQQLTGGQQPAYNSSQNSNYQNYQNYQPPQQNYQTYSNPTGTTPNWGAGSGTGNNQAVQQANAAYAAGQRGADPSKVPGYENMDAWRQWYSQQQGGKRPEDMARFSPETLAGWDQYLIKEGPNAGKYRSMRAGVEGVFDKPTECPPGYSPGGPNETDGCVPNGGAGGGAGGGGGQGGGGGYGAGGVTAGGEQQGDLALYTVKKQYADALADPTGQKAWELYAGQGGQKTFQAEMDRYRQQIAGMPQGPARQAAEQKMREVESSMRLDMPQQARTQALQGLSGIIQPELGYVGSERDRALQKLLGIGGLENQRYGMNLNYNLGSRGLDLQGQNQMWNQNTYFPWQAGNAAATLANDRWGTEYQGQQQNAANAGATTGAMLQQGAEYFMSDIRMKENIVPGRRGLSDLLKLGSYSYNYKGKPERTQSIMAQDVEKVAPEFVKEFDGIKMVDSQGLLGMTMKAVQDLAKKMEKK